MPVLCVSGKRVLAYFFKLVFPLCRSRLKHMTTSLRRELRGPHVEELAVLGDPTQGSGISLLDLRALQSSGGQLAIETRVRVFVCAHVCLFVCFPVCMHASMPVCLFACYFVSVSLCVCMLVCLYCIQYNKAIRHQCFGFWVCFGF